MPQADRTAGTVFGTVVGVGIIGTIAVVTFINKCGQISKHVDATTPMDTTPAYSLIHTDEPQIYASMQPLNAAAPVYPSAPPAPGSGVYGDAYFAPQYPPADPSHTTPAYTPQANGGAPLSSPYPPADPVYLTPASAPSADMSPAMPIMNTINYEGHCPKEGETLSIMCPALPQTRREIQYIQFKEDPTFVYELNGKICPGATSTFTASDGKLRTIRWINPRARR